MLSQFVSLNLSLKSNQNILTFEKVRCELTTDHKCGWKTSVYTKLSHHLFSIGNRYSVFVYSIYFIFVVNRKFKVIVWTFVANRLKSSMQHYLLNWRIIWPKLTLPIIPTKIGLFNILFHSNNTHAICAISLKKRCAIPFHIAFCITFIRKDTDGNPQWKHPH